jgi:hypothetical protein
MVIVWLDVKEGPSWLTAPTQSIQAQGKAVNQMPKHFNSSSFNYLGEKHLKII